MEDNSLECVDPEPDIAANSNHHCHTKDLQKTIEQTFAAALLKLEHLVHVPSKAVDEFFGELHHLICFATAPLSSDILSSIFDERDLPVNESIINEIVKAISTDGPVQSSIQKGGPLSMAYLRKQYYKQNFSIVEPVEYCLNAKYKQFSVYPNFENLGAAFKQKGYCRSC